MDDERRREGLTTRSLVPEGESTWFTPAVSATEGGIALAGVRAGDLGGRVWDRGGAARSCQDRDCAPDSGDADSPGVGVEEGEIAMDFERLDRCLVDIDGA